MQNDPKKVNKNFSLDADPGHASERIVDHLNGFKRRHGMAMTKMRNWMTAGYLLDEFGHGIIEYLLSTDDQRKPVERLQALVKYIERCEVSVDASILTAPIAVQAPKPAFTSRSEPLTAPTASEPTPTKKPGRLGQ